MSGPRTGPAQDLDRMLGCLIEPVLARLAARLRSVPGLAPAEQAALCAGTAAGLRDTVWRKVSRVVVLELHAARLAGSLTAADSGGRWREWVETVGRPRFWEAMADPYPALVPRLRRVLENRCGAAVTLARRFVRDRPVLPALTGVDPGALLGVEFGAGDSHRGGQTVAVLRFSAHKVVYKPRSLAVDRALARLLPRVLPGEPAETRIRVPAVVTSEDSTGGYGFAAFVTHQYCRDETQLATYYRGLGHWLAVLRLLAGSDLHAENLIAAGPVPVVIDCETLFTPHRGSPATGCHAVDLATELVEGSVLRTGLLPGRAASLGYRGVDPSGAGALPGQQPSVSVPVIVNEGTDRARVGTMPVPLPPAANLPSPTPDLGRYWHRVVAGYEELTEHMQRMDEAGRLAPLLAEFAACQVRVVLRDTAVYTELMRMLWHPSSLHRPEAATARAARLLERHASRQPAAPADPAVIDAEVAELGDGDVPIFTTAAGCGELAGPGGIRSGAATDLVADALRRWRQVAPAADRQVVQAALLGAFLDEGWLASPQRLSTPRGTRVGLDRRRRAPAAGIVCQLHQRALFGRDGTVTWVAPALGATGWGVQPLSADLYSGLAGVAVLLAAYLREAAHGRADDVPETSTLLAAVLATLRRMEAQQDADRAAEVKAGVTVRPEPPGGYVGLGSRVWAWLLLGRLGALAPAEALTRAEAQAGQLSGAIAADETHDLLMGAAGAVVPLLRLAEYAASAGRAGSGRQWTALALRIGHRLADFGRRHRSEGGGWRWPGSLSPEGLGGLSHGASGIGWAASRLASTTADPVCRRLASAAFRFEEELYDPAVGGWRDLRFPAPQTAAAWCHGAVGIGIGAADLLRVDDAERWRDVLARASRATWSDGLGWNHTLCHGDLGCWELLRQADAAGVPPDGLDLDRLTVSLVSSIEENGPVWGIARDVFVPGLLAGQGGIAYQLLRMHPDADLPSVLLPDPGGPIG